MHSHSCAGRSSHHVPNNKQRAMETIINTLISKIIVEKSFFSVYMCLYIVIKSYTGMDWSFDFILMIQG